MESPLSMADDTRLERIEQKLDRLSDAVVSLARMEERMITLFRRMDTYDADQKEMLKRLADIERISIGRGVFFRSMDKLIWMVVGGGVALAIGYLQAKF